MSTETLEFTSVPVYGSYVNLRGVVRRADVENLRVAVYIQVDGGWWTKPSWDSPCTPISADGSFSVDITTVGNKEEANEISAFLIPVEYSPPSLRGEPELPAELHEMSLAHVNVTRTI
jgi:hypothetical protein